MRVPLSLLVCLALPGCFLLPANKPAVPKDAIKIGILAPITGTSAQLGSSVSEGVQLAIKHVNEAGGVLGKQLTPIVVDTQSDPLKAGPKANELIDRGVMAIIGDINSSASKPAILEAAKPRGCVMVSPASTSPELTDTAKLDSGGYFFRTVASDEQQGRVMAKLALSNGYKKLAIIHVDNTYGLGFATVIKAAFEAEAGHTTSLITYSEEPTPKTSYTEVIDKLVAAAPDAVAMIGYPGGCSQIYKDWILAGKLDTLPWLCGQALRLDSFTNNIPDKKRLDGVRGTYPNQSGPNFERFAADYQAKWGQPHGTLYAATAYDATLLVTYALAKAGGEPSREGVKANIRAASGPEGTVVTPGVDGIKAAFAAIAAGQAINYEGASGPVDFNDKGDISTASYVIWKIANGKFENTPEILQP